MLVSIDIFGLQIRTFGVMVAVAFLVAGGLIGRRLKELDLPVEWAYEVGGAAALGGFAGARIYFVVQNGIQGGILRTAFSGSGLIWYGGVVGGALAVLAWAAWRRPGWLLLVDLAAPALALGYAVGRVACQLTGDGTYGVPSHLPWAMGYPDGTVPTPPGIEVHPTPVYETLAMGLVAVWLWRRRNAFAPGVLFASYLVLAGLERLMVEFIRRNSEIVAGLTAAQLESIGMFAVGLTWLLIVATRGGLKRSATPAPRPV